MLTANQLWVEEKLNDLLRLKEIQDRVITLRTEVPSMYGENLRKECNATIKNLLSSEVKYDAPPLQIPEQRDFGDCKIKILPECSLSDVSQKCNRVLECLTFRGK